MSGRATSTQDEERPATIGAIDTRTPVLVLSARTHGSLGILRSLGRLGIPVFAVDSDPLGPAAHSRYLRDRFVFDLATASPDETVDYLLGVGKIIGSRTVLIPTWDETSLLVADSYDRLSERFLLPQQPAKLAQALSSKRDMYAIATRDAIPTPGAVFPSGIDDVRSFSERAAFPVMLKGIDGNRLKLRTGRKMVIVKSPDELARRYLEMEDPADPNLMLQEYIPGGDDVVWMFNGYFDRNSDCLAGYTGRKLRQTPVYTGATSLGICQRNDTVEQTTMRWMKQLGYRGILDIGYRYDARDGRYKVLDVNPRIGATFRLFVARNGMDVARALYLDLTDQPVPGAAVREGRKWMVEQDVASCLQYRRDGKLTLRQWIGSLKGVEEMGYFAADDLAPFAQLCRAFVGDAFRQLNARRKHAPEPRPVLTRQDEVDQHFASAAGAWKAIYEERSVNGIIYRERQATALDWIDGLALPAGAPVLDVGSGAGLTSAALLERGFAVTAIDSTPVMVELTERLARDRGLADRLSTAVADVHSLPYPDCSFSVVLALGVLPWLHSPALALGEMARVLRPGGFMLVSVDNALRLHQILDPRLNPALESIRGIVGRRLRKAGLLGGAGEPTLIRQDSPRRLDDLIRRAGLEKVRGTTMGFGPFTFWKRPVLPGGAGIRLHHRLQALADRNAPVIGGAGAHYVVLARRSDDLDGVRS